MQLAGVDGHIEAEHVLAVIDLPQARAFTYHDVIAHRLDADARERHLVGKVAAQILERALDALLRDLRLHERPRRAQHDEVLEGKLVLATRSARRFHEAAVDQPLYGAARQLQDSLDVPHAV